MNDHPDDLYDDEELIEAYCMTCRQKTSMEGAEPIWTRRGAPGTRGTCSICGTTVFRMGRTPAHDQLKRPEPVKVSDSSRGRAGRPAPPVTYINFSTIDADFAAKLADDLNRIGIQTWLAGTDVNNVQWATGVHPALVECKRMIVVLTPFSAKAINVIEAWNFFLETHKPVYVAQLEPVEMPDELRSKPRFDFAREEYKRAFRELLQALST
jgi:hypothetical protein